MHSLCGTLTIKLKLLPELSVGEMLNELEWSYMYSKICDKPPLKNRQNNDLNGKWLLNEGRKYCRMLGAFGNTFDLH